MICRGVPQPWLGRCWNRPNESWSLRLPRFPRLYSDDSCIAVATATTHPQRGTPMRAPTATMVAALATWVAVHDPSAAQPPPAAASGEPEARAGAHRPL